MEKRYKVRFRSAEALRAALAMESADVAPVVVNPRRRYVTLQPGPAVMAEMADPEARDATAQRAAERMAQAFNAEVVIDHQYDLEQVPPHVLVEAAPEAAEASLEDVVEMNKAKEAWATARGENVTIAIVDTGVHGGHLEFAAAKRATEGGLFLATTRGPIGRDTARCAHASLLAPALTGESITVSRRTRRSCPARRISTIPSLRRSTTR